MRKIVSYFKKIDKHMDYDSLLVKHSNKIRSGIGNKLIDYICLPIQ